MDWTREGKLYFPAENSNFYFLPGFDGSDGFESGSDGFERGSDGFDEDEKDEVITSSESELGRRIFFKTHTLTIFHEKLKSSAFIHFLFFIIFLL